MRENYKEVKFSYKNSEGNSLDSKILNQDLLSSWLNQFSKKDVNIAKALIEDINFIDQTDFDRYTANCVKNIISASENTDNIGSVRNFVSVR